MPPSIWQPPLKKKEEKRRAFCLFLTLLFLNDNECSSTLNHSKGSAGLMNVCLINAGLLGDFFVSDKANLIFHLLIVAEFYPLLSNHSKSDNYGGQNQKINKFNIEV